MKGQIVARHNLETLDRLTARLRPKRELGGYGICQHRLLRGQDIWQAVAPSAARADRGDYADIPDPDPLLPGLTELARHNRDIGIIVEVHRVEDLDRRVAAGRKLGYRVEVGERDLMIEAAVDDEGEELLKSRGIVIESQPAVGEMGPQQFEHEALALEITIAPALTRPPLCQPNELREMDRIGLLAAADKVQVLPHAGLSRVPSSLLTR